MPKYICFPVVEPPSSGGFDGCIASILIVFAIGGLIVAGFNHLFGLDKNNDNVAQQSQSVPMQSRTNTGAGGYRVQHQQFTEKHLGYHSAHKIREADFKPEHHSRVRVSEYSNKSDASEANSLHSNTNYGVSGQDQGRDASAKSSDAAVGDLHSNSDVSNSSTSTDTSGSSSSDGDISGGLH